MKPIERNVEWRVSSRCSGGNCVQFAQVTEGVALRDSKNPDAGALYYSLQEWHAFVAAAKAGAYDLTK
ncbi:DUF397 domain-containing protein [Microbispora hainanensis]|uniref:DUF397 domain-containing protein n=1 Tax=Microbispora hainanensis TaxID=568844 RepID=A0ABZ1T387_9ACTN|nr:MULTISPECIES: DUF397 domain-containing protein [Microbispora]NJP24890.1 DUF397 domain-containing protein [Microbispora sp. CL1-1]TQS14349.1 DUF397 domain-containing protein [Microbispora sp. SCL1-1]